ncbi:uncharacterized protein [Arachis hypogaea]|uniref:uncharacterized protein isoform X2 n=1 Tax=Arachis hypogaea TaxID=3818 RepID=UPI000DEC53B4|nr:seed biotin-containing protein SBP65 isoform X2 [Arachis hypogaea]
MASQQISRKENTAQEQEGDSNKMKTQTQTHHVVTTEKLQQGADKVRDSSSSQAQQQHKNYSTQENKQKRAEQALSDINKKAYQHKQKEQQNSRGRAQQAAAKDINKKGEEKKHKEQSNLGGISRSEQESSGETRREKNDEQPSLEEISKYRSQAQQNSMDAISAAQERYQIEKQAAEGTGTGTSQIPQDKTAIEKGKEGYVAAKDTVSKVAKGTKEYTAPVAEKAKEYTVQAAEKAKEATVEGGKSAAEVAVDLKDKATAAGWSAAHYSTDKTVEGTKVVSGAVQGAAGYAGQKASELAAKSVGTVKGLAAAAGDSAKEYTARKMDEKETELEAKKAAQRLIDKKKSTEVVERGGGQEQEGGVRRGSEERTFQGDQGAQLGGVAKTQGQVTQAIQKGTKGTVGNVNNQREQQPYQNVGETLGDGGERVKPLDNVNEGGSQVLGAVGETVAEIGETMIKPAMKAQSQGRGGGGGGVLNAIGETIAEIAETTQVYVVGEGEAEQRQNIV